MRSLIKKWYDGKGLGSRETKGQPKKISSERLSSSGEDFVPLSLSLWPPIATAGLSPGGLSSCIEARLTHQYRLVRTFPVLPGKLLPSLATIDECRQPRNETSSPSSLLFLFILLLLSPPPPRPLRPLRPPPRLPSTPLVSFLHGELSASVSWERRLVSFPSRFHAIVGVCQPADTRGFFHIYSRSVHYSPSPSPPPPPPPPPSGSTSFLHGDGQQPSYDRKVESIWSGSDGKLSPGNWWNWEGRWRSEVNSRYRAVASEAT